jgi:protein-disulfide isomerase
VSPLTQAVTAEDHVSGPEDAPITLVEYGDFECPHCGRAYPIVKSVKEQLGKELRLAFRHFPLTQSHPHALRAAEAAEASAEQGEFWAMHDKLFENQAALEDEDLIQYAREIGVDADRVARELDDGIYEDEVKADFSTGVRSGVNGTPTFFINGERFDGDWSDAGSFIEALRSAAPAP